MAPAPTYELPPAQMLALAMAARRRGLDFEEFWMEAVRPGRKQGRITTAHPDPPAGAVRWPSEWSEGTQWREAVVATKEAWRRRYEGEEPTRAESALVELGDSIGVLATVLEDVEPEPEPERELADLMAAA